MNKTSFYYGLMAFPLAFAGLPLYVHLPFFLETVYGLPLSMIGTILLGLRIFDTLQDPLIGYSSDRVSWKRSKLVIAGSFFLAFGFLVLFSLSPQMTTSSLIFWVILSLLFVFTGFSFAQINLYALNLEIVEEKTSLISLSGWREGFFVFGILAASALPLLFQYTGLKQQTSFIVMAGILLLIVLLSFYPFHKSTLFVRKRSQISLRDFIFVAQNKELLLFFVVFGLSALAYAFPATLFFFFVRDTLNLESYGGLFLFLYFLSCLVGMPLWSYLGKRINPKKIYFLAGILVIFIFFWAIFLTTGDFYQYLTIVLFSGFLLGVDLTLPPVLIGEISRKSDHSISITFSLWTFINKTALALSAGIAFPFIEWSPVLSKSGTTALFYAAVPCGLKIISMIGFYFLTYKENEKFKSIKG